MRTADSTGPRDALVTGMGFCLPGADGMPCTSRADFWRSISAGTSHVERDGVFFGRFDLPGDTLGRWFPALPDGHLRNYSEVHRYGLVSLGEACADAGLDPRSGDLRDAAVLTARVSVDTSFDTYKTWLDADPEQLTPAQARALFARLGISVGMTDVAVVQAAVLGSTGPNFTLSCGCASSAVLIGTAQQLIAAGETEMAVVTGVDHYNLDRRDHAERLLAVAARTEGAQASAAGRAAAAHVRCDELMRPYDEAAAGTNLGIGSVTLILESREHAYRRETQGYARVVAQSTRRAPLTSAVGVDEQGSACVAAIGQCLGAAGITAGQVDYVNGGANGDPLLGLVESNALGTVFGESVAGLPVSSQEACFGHSGAPLGALGVAATALMAQRGEVCPTAACQKPSPECPFDPLPGTMTRRRRIGYALSMNHQVGSIASAVLIAAEKTR
ncbi:MAG: hypothetical protein JOY82_05750 [Streptosporangiaceae bacterium]|nr:hypothetical protein [Streptosporangiaceae bacterium]MBV9854013.1 hypothetical protein [Streptosporangiaceae bacterium]